MKGKKQIIKRTGAFALAAFIGVFMLTSCNNNDEEKNDESSEIQSSEEEARELILSIGDISEGLGSDLSVTKVYSAKEINTGSQVISPQKNNVFIIADIEIKNKTDETYYFDFMNSIIPSVDNQIVDLRDWTAVFPDELDGVQNMLNTVETSVLPNSSTTGFIAFEASNSFRYCDFTYYNYDTVINIFKYAASKNAVEPEKTINAIASDENDEITMLVTNVHRLSDHKDLPAPAQSKRYVQATVAILNKTELIREAYYQGFRAECKGSELRPVKEFQLDEKLPPQKYYVFTAIFEVPDDADTFKLIYKDLINDKSLSAELETWKT